MTDDESKKVLGQLKANSARVTVGQLRALATYALQAIEDRKALVAPCTMQQRVDAENAARRHMEGQS